MIDLAGCKALTNSVNESDPSNLNFKGTQDALSTVRNIYNDNAENLTGDKFILRTNSSAPSNMKEKPAESPPIFDPPSDIQ